MLEVHNVTRKFGGLVAVSDASLSVASGEIVGLIGPNGAGKSTLFNVIANVYTPTSGHVSVGGTDLGGKKPHDLAKHGVARTFQTPRPFGKLSVLDNVIVAAMTKNPRRRVAEPLARQALERVHLADAADLPASSLPLGMRKRLEVARGLALDPTLVLLDEVLGGLNPDETEAMVDVIVGLRNDGVAVCMIEHVMAVIMDICDRIYVLHHGQIIASGTPEEIRAHPEVVEAYLGTPDASKGDER